MTGSTLITELHSFRGFHIDGGPLGRVVCVGFVSFTYMPFLLTQWLRGRIENLRSVADDDDNHAAADRP